jgi:hypothetical protein
MTYLVFSGPINFIKEALVQWGRQVQGHVYEPLTDNEPSPPLLSLQNSPQLLRCVLVLFTPRPQEPDNLLYRLGILQQGGEVSCRLRLEGSMSLYKGLDCRAKRNLPQVQVCDMRNTSR